MTADDFLRTPEGHRLYRESPLFHKLCQALRACLAPDRDAVVVEVVTSLVLENLNLRRALESARDGQPIVINLVQDTAVVHKDGKENLHV